MKHLGALIVSEIIKLRRTLAFWMMLIAPSFVIVLQVMLWMNQKDGIAIDADLWIMFGINIFSMWGVFMFPLFCALVVALVYHYEHTTSGWQKMYTLPVPRWMILAAKQSVALYLLLGSGVALFAGIILGGFLINAIHPAITMPLDIPYAYLLHKWLAMTGASLLMFAIQNWTSYHWQTLSVPIGVGIAGTFIAIFATSWKYGHFYPWLMPIHVLHRTGGEEVLALWGGVIGGAALLVVMNILESRRDVISS